MRTISALALAAATLTGATLVALSGCGHFTSYRSERTLATALPASQTAGSGLTLVADFRHGSLSVTGHGGDEWHCEADVTVWADDQPTADAVAADLAITTERDGDRVIVRVAPASDRWSSDDYRVGIRSRFRVPTATALDVASTHGALRFENLRGDIRARSTHGAIAVHSVDGNADVRSSHGAILVTDLNGTSHTLRSTHGGASVRGVAGTVRLTTSHGAVDADLGLQTAGASEIVTSHGAVVLRLSPESSAAVIAHTSHGQISCDLNAQETGFTSRAGAMVIGEGAADINIRTSHGAVRIAQSSESISRKAE